MFRGTSDQIQKAAGFEYAFSRVTDFIQNFKDSEDTFLHGCCYWFAFILHKRFALDIVYEPVEGHFLAISPGMGIPCKPNRVHHIFDIRGDVTDLYNTCTLYPVRWLSINEPNWYTHLMRDCRDFLPAIDEPTEEESA